MYIHGLNGILKILSATKEQLAKIPTFKEKSVTRIYTNIHASLKNIKTDIVLGASGIFGMGMGRKRVALLLTGFPNILTIYKLMAPEKIKSTILKIEGFSEIMTEQIVNNLKQADQFLKKISVYATFDTSEELVSDQFKGQKIVCTGFRDKDMEKHITIGGGKISSTVSKTTTVLIVAVKDGKLTGKVKKATDLKVPIKTKEEFMLEYSLN
jgi:NAD-dependent DNA ligase